MAAETPYVIRRTLHGAPSGTISTTTETRDRSRVRVYTTPGDLYPVGVLEVLTRTGRVEITLAPDELGELARAVWAATDELLTDLHAVTPLDGEGAA